jgi:predicted ATPase/DNA-binding CsgD family transcriptional regulator
MSSFLGRGAQMADIAKTLRSARLVTLTGVAGVGKSRVALRVVNAVSSEYGYIAWAQLDTVAGARDVPAAVLGALGTHARSGTEVTGSIEPGSGLLLVLDNCEHVLGNCAELVQALLERFAGVRVLATSREPLGLRGEVVVSVGPLPLPRGDEPMDDIVHNDAVRLFVERARARVSSFDLTPESTEIVAGICRSLDGIPLAIELAAARMATMTVADVASRLNDPLALLTSNGRTDAARHQTFRASLDWSYTLLGDSERRLLRSLSVFAGGFTSDAAVSVCATEDVPAARIPILLERLVAQSLVQAWERDGTMRFGLFSAVRSYTLLLLSQAGEENAARHRHMEWSLSLADRTASEPLEGEQMSRLHSEEPNLRAALHWAMKTSRADEGMRLAILLGRVWWLTGCLPDVVGSYMGAAVSDMHGKHQREVWPRSGASCNSSSQPPSAALGQFEPENLSATVCTDTSCQRPLPENGIASKTDSVASVPIVTIPTLLTTRLGIDVACCPASDSHEQLTATVAQRQRAGADRRQNTRELTELMPARSAASHPLRSVGPTVISPADEGDLGLAGDEVVKSQLVDGLDPDACADKRQVVSRTTREKPARLLDANPFAALEPGKSPPLNTLSQRELDVARLVAGGRSNREIAEELVISRKTAEAHVSHILTKLGMWRRVQIATWSMQHGLGVEAD